MQQPQGQQHNQYDPSYAPGTYGRGGTAAQAAPATRAKFIERTYLHLAGAIFAFVGLEAVLLNTEFGLNLARTMLSGSWLVVLIAFMAVSWIADRWARSDRGQGMQYLGLALYVVAEAIIFCPLMFIANSVSMQEAGGSVILPAGVTTLAVFAGITGYVFISKQNFSWIRGGLTAASFAALAIIVLSLLFGFHLGMLFMGVMVLLAGGYVLYYTSNVLHEYDTNSHVAAALALFAAIALMFWYILQIFMGGGRD